MDSKKRVLNYSLNVSSIAYPLLWSTFEITKKHVQDKLRELQKIALLIYWFEETRKYLLFNKHFMVEAKTLNCKTKSES